MAANVDASSGMLATILATAPIGVLAVDAENGRVLMANEHYKRFLDPEWWDRDITDYTLAELLPNYAQTPLPDIIRNVAKAGETMRTANSEYHGFARGITYWSYDAVPLRDVAGVESAVLFTIVEVTEQVVARRELEATNAALAALAAVNVTISSSLDLDEVMDRVLTVIAPIIPYIRAMVVLDDGQDGLQIVAARNRGQQDIALIGTVLPKHGSLNGQVFRDGRSLRVRDLQHPTDKELGMYYPPSFDPELRAALCTPLITRGTVIGTIYLGSDTLGEYREEDLQRLELFAPQAASALANAQLYREAADRATEWETLSDVALTVAASLALPDVLHHILQKIAEVVGYDQAIVALSAEDGENLRIVSGQGSRLGKVVGTTIPINASICGVAFRENRAMVIPNLADAPEWDWRQTYPHAPRPKNDRAALVVPLVAQAETLGALLLVRELPNGYAAADLERLKRFAAPIAVAIANARLYERVQNQVAELSRLNGDLETANRHKSEFLATMSHELRTPLNAILGFTQLLQDDIVSDPDEQRQCLDDIYASAEHLLKIINDVLDIAKIEAGEMRLQREAFAVASEIAEAERFMAPLIARNRQTLSVQVAPQLPRIYADRGRIRQIVLNLLSNANKFTPEHGTITVTADAAGDVVRVQVRDTGIGIRPEDRPKVFQEFRQIDGSLTRRYSGTGLGLALSKRLIELQGGTISFESEPGVGTTFMLILPAASEATPGLIAPAG